MEGAKPAPDGAAALSAAELFVAGHFSEALNEYETGTTSGPPSPSHASPPGTRFSGARQRQSDSRAVYAACNRAVAKLQLEMYRSCLLDCREAIGLDPYCLRAHLLTGASLEIFFPQK